MGMDMQSHTAKSETLKQHRGKRNEEEFRIFIEFCVLCEKYLDTNKLICLILRYLIF